MKKKTKITVYWLVGIVVLGAAIAAWIYTVNQPGPYDQFASCLEEKGANFYGAYWCPACNQQKALFGRSADQLPYTECSLPGGQGQNALCQEENIGAYPTWEFADGERVTGVLSLEELAKRTECTLLGN